MGPREEVATRGDEGLGSTSRAVLAAGTFLLFSGALTSVIGVYAFVAQTNGRDYLGFGFFTGFLSLLAGIGGIKTGSDFRNRHFLRGYFILSALSLLSSLGLLGLCYLALANPQSGENLLHVLGAILAALASLSLLVVLVGVVASCCFGRQAPRQANTVEPRLPPESFYV